MALRKTSPNYYCLCAPFFPFNLFHLSLGRLTNRHLMKGADSSGRGVVSQEMTERQELPKAGERWGFISKKQYRKSATSGRQLME